MKQLLVFILFATVLCWLMFAPVYRHVLILRQAVLQKEVDYLLEVGASGARGYIDESLIEESKLRLEARGFDPVKLNYTVSTTTGVSGSNPADPVPRGVGIRLHVTYPLDGLLRIDRLIGLAVPETGEIGAAGMKMSEYVPVTGTS